MRRNSWSPLQWVGERPELLPGVLAVGVFVAWGAEQGGYFATASAPGGLLLLGLVGAVTFGFRHRLRDIPLSLRIALVLLAGFVAWSFVSITWAEAKGVAWDGANRGVVYLAAFALFAIIPWRIRSAGLILGLWSLAVALVGVITVIKAKGAEEPITYFIGDLFAEPTGYHNSNAALFGIAFWPALISASRKEAPWPWRALMLAVAVVLFELALLPQSRGWLITFSIAGAIALALVSGRVRLIVTCAALVPAVLLAADPILDVFDVASAEGNLANALNGALDAMVLSAGAMLAVGAALAWIDRGLRRELGVWRAAKVAVAVLATAVAVGGVVVAVGETGNPVSWADERWEDFKDASPREIDPGSRLGGALGSNRYDFWRVSMDSWGEQPLTGIGIDNFAIDYVRERHSGEEPLHPHSLPVKVLSQTGLVGALLFAGFLAAAVTAAVRTRFGAAVDLARVVAGGVLVTCAYWFLHSAGDWFWAMPALTAPAFAWLGLAGSLDRAPALQTEPPGALGGRGRAAVALGAAVALLVAAASLVLPWRAQVDVDAAARGWRVDAAASFERLDRANDLNPLSPTPSLIEGAIASRLGDHRRMREAFTQALEREPENWYAVLELGALDAIEGDRAGALVRLERALELNPRDPVIREVRAAVMARRTYPLRRIDSALLQRACDRLGQGRSEATEDCE